MKRLIIIAATLLAFLSPAIAADSSVPGMGNATSVAGTDGFYCIQGAGTTEHECTATQLSAYIQSTWGVITSGDVIVGGGAGGIQDGSTVSSVTFPVGLSSIQAITQSTSMSTAASVFDFKNTATGTCTDSTKCYINLWQTTESTPIINNSPTARYHNWWNSVVNGGNMGTAASAFFNEMDVSIGSSTAMTGSGNFNFTTFRPFMDVNGSMGGGIGSERGAVFAINPQITLGAGAANMHAGIVQENDFAAATGVNYLDLILLQNSIGAAHRTAGTRQNVSYVTVSAAALGGSVPGLTTLFQDGQYDGWPAIATTGGLFKCYPHANTGTCGAIAYGFDLSNYTAVSGNILTGPASNGSIDGNFNVVANNVTVNGTCTGCGTFPQVYFSAHLSGNQTGVAAGTATKVTFNTVDINQGGYYDGTTNFQFTPLLAGTYKISLSVTLAAAGSTTGNESVWIYKNGSPFELCQLSPPNTNAFANTVSCSALVALNGSTDNVEAFAAAPSSTTVVFDAQVGGAVSSRFEGSYIGP